ncbi:MAG TPA: DUF2304 domain-containing protein [Solirubrobacteraceae bacterium]|nr:DUF2304 domain-containing protein [Solirubrobacteraceae bacterium]
MSSESRVQLLAILGTIVLLATILELVRRRRLLERYAVLWLFSAAVLLVLAVWRDLLESVARRLGFEVPANLLFVLGLGFAFMLLLHFSLAVSQLAERTKVLAQRLALLQQRLSETERELEAARAPEATDERDREGAVRAP